MRKHQGPKVVLVLSGEMFRDDKPTTAVGVKVRVEVAETLTGLAGEDPNSAAQVRLSGALATQLAPEVIAAARTLLNYFRPQPADPPPAPSGGGIDFVLVEPPGIVKP